MNSQFHMTPMLIDTDQAPNPYPHRFKHSVRSDLLVFFHNDQADLLVDLDGKRLLFDEQLPGKIGPKADSQSKKNKRPRIQPQNE